MRSQDIWLLRIQSILLGEVTPELRSVCLDFDEKNNEVSAVFYYDCDLDEDIMENVSCLETEMWATVSGDEKILFKAVSCKYPEKMELKGQFVYYRKEINLKT